MIKVKFSDFRFRPEKQGYQAPNRFDAWVDGEGPHQMTP
jgi:hypothetical protein